MVPKGSRLPHDEFRARGYKNIATPYFSVKIKKNSLKINRIGIVIGAAAIKSAVRRNFLRRQVGVVLSEIPQKGIDFLVIMRPHQGRPAKKSIQESLRDATASLLANL